MSQHLTEEEIEQLGEIKLDDPRIEVITHGLVYGVDEIVIGKTPHFSYTEGTVYPKRNPQPYEDEDGLPKKLRPISWAALRDQPFPENEWYIQGLVPKYGITMLAAASGEKKTWLAMHIAYCIATGSHLFGDEKFLSTQGRVLYIDAEMGPRELQRRGKLLGFDHVPEDNLFLITGDAISIRSEEAFEELAQIVEGNSIDVLVIDTLRGIAGGINEDKAEEIRAFLQRFNALKNQGIAVIILDHCRKPIRNEGYAPRKEQLLGSQDKVASAESVIMLKSETNSDSFAVYQVKSRTGTEIKPFLMLMRDVIAEDRIEFRYNGEYDEQVSKMDTAKTIIPQIIGTGLMTTKQLVAAMQEDHKVGERYVRDALRLLVKKELLVVEKLGREHAYKNTDVGLLLNQVDETLGVAEVVDH